VSRFELLYQIIAPWSIHLAHKTLITAIWSLSSLRQFCNVYRRPHLPG